MDPDQTLADLMHTAGHRLLRLAYQLTHDRASAEDVVQEALMQVCRSWRRRAPGVAHAEAYVRRAVINEYLRRRRGLARWPDRRVDRGPRKRRCAAWRRGRWPGCARVRAA
jgi:DNA-directed RNA polymerase specialized sigma24 family protein